MRHPNFPTTRYSIDELIEYVEQLNRRFERFIKYTKLKDILKILRYVKRHNISAEKSPPRLTSTTPTNGK
jgi:hypothetical protein